MNAETLKALKASIAKWERNARTRKPENFTTGPADCALCRLFWERGCDGCPVSEKTGMPCCSGSPYAEAEFAAEEWLDTGASDDGAIALSAARAEVEFLKSLLPDGESA